MRREDRRYGRRNRQKNRHALIVSVMLVMILACSAGIVSRWIYNQECGVVFAGSPMHQSVDDESTAGLALQTASFDPEKINQAKVKTQTLMFEDSFTADGAYLVDMQGNVLYEKNADKQLYPASMTKIMTALVAVENGNLDDTVTVGQLEGCYEEGSKLTYLEEGDVCTLRDLLYATLLYSANDAATAVAVYIGGDVATFAGMMNQKAAELGANNTHFANPHGLHNEDHYTTPRDVSLIMRAATENATVMEIMQTPTYSCTITRENGGDNEHHYTWNSTNVYMRGTDTLEGIQYICGKTGYTGEAGRCLVSYFQLGEESYISVIMNSKDYALATKQLAYYKLEPDLLETAVRTQAQTDS